VKKLFNIIAGLLTKPFDYDFDETFSEETCELLYKLMAIVVGIKLVLKSYAAFDDGFFTGLLTSAGSVFSFVALLILLRIVFQLLIPMLALTAPLLKAFSKFTK